MFKMLLFKGGVHIYAEQCISTNLSIIPLKYKTHLGEHDCGSSSYKLPRLDMIACISCYPGPLPYPKALAEAPSWGQCMKLPLADPWQVLILTVHSKTQKGGHKLWILRLIEVSWSWDEKLATPGLRSHTTIHILHRHNEDAPKDADVTLDHVYIFPSLYEYVQPFFFQVILLNKDNESPRWRQLHINHLKKNNRFSSHF